MSEKNLPPSEQRVKRARESGQIGVSQDLVSVLKFAILIEVAFGTEPAWRAMVDEIVRSSVAGIARPWVARFDGALASFVQTMYIIVAMSFVAAAISLFATLTQTRLNVAPEALTKGAEKLDPGKNLKQLVSPQKLLMLVIGPIKIAAVLCVCYFEIDGKLPAIGQLFRLSLEQGWVFTVDMLHGLARTCMGVLVVLALFDIALQRYLVYRSLRVNREEAERDHKESEGDPHTKGKRTGIAKQVAAEAPKQRAPDASVVVVNPEHIAVALAWDFQAGTVPRVVDKGRDADALVLRKLAQGRRIPVIKYVALARQLYATGHIGAVVPRHSLRAVALLFRAVQELKKAADPAYPGDGDLPEIDEEVGAEMMRRR